MWNSGGARACRAVGFGGGGLPNVRMMFREGIKVSFRIEPDYAKTLAEPRRKVWQARLEGIAANRSKGRSVSPGLRQRWDRLGARIGVDRGQARETLGSSRKLFGCSGARLRQACGAAGPRPTKVPIGRYRHTHKSHRSHKARRAVGLAEAGPIRARGPAPNLRSRPFNIPQRESSVTEEGEKMFKNFLHFLSTEHCKFR